ncbi:MAG: hypothetical protein HY909_15655 [Deltaproteobacteria bacterium]|nr:hypothetical protein [Deltaproteobacteria bacterium]
MKFGPLGWVLDRVLLKRKLHQALEDVFRRLARHAEGGGRSGGGGRHRLR